MKTCRRCNTPKPVSEFYARRDRMNGKGLVSRCKSCQIEVASKWAKDNKDRVNDGARRRKDENPEYQYERVLNNRLKMLYGISLAAYQTMLHMQGGGCFICGEKPPAGTRLCVDHNHTTGKVRALLCINCNQGIGNFRDDKALLTKAKDYLEKFDAE
jgi:Recombination endonuclease VII